MGNKQPIILKSLISLSILLLLLFLIFWNLDNYNREKKEFVITLSNQMDLSCAAYKDSVIQGIFKVIDFDAKVSAFIGGDTLLINEHNLIHTKYDESNKELVQSQPDSNIVAFLKKSVKTYETALDTAITVLVDRNHSDRKIFVWDSDIEATAVKVRYEEDSVTGIDFSEALGRDTSIININVKSTNIPLLYLKIDTIFRRRLVSNDIISQHDIRISYTDAETDNIVIPFDYGGMFSQKGVAAVFYNYSSYLFRKILPSLLLSIGLFVIIALSFFVILKSWSNQSRLMNIKNEFISNMTHELKTPIATVGVAIEALERYGALDDIVKRKEYIDISKHELSRLNILVDKVLKMSTLDQDFEELIMTRLDMSELIADVLQAMKLRLDKNGIAVMYSEEGADFIIEGDKVHLTNVLYNLLDNAIKYSLENPGINVILKENQKTVSISIIDKGIGIPKEYHTKVFERFFRVPNQDRHNVKGHGLGLHYVRTIIRKHNGDIMISSPGSIGTNFSLVIPK